MLYQNLLIGESPYHASVDIMGDFEEHRHPEIEFSFCMQGSYPMYTGTQKFTVKKGDLSIIGSMVSHGFPPNPDDTCRVLTLEVGPAFLSEYFELFSKGFSDIKVFSLDDEKYDELKTLLYEIADVCNDGADYPKLILKGDLYKICVHLLREFAELESKKNTTQSSVAIEKIEKSLDYIRKHYNENITVEKVATLNGYSKSNFCKIFKNITGHTFHNVLNRHRTQKVAELLKYTTLSMEDIAAQTGFADAKSMYRVFKSFTGIPPIVFRKNYQGRE